MILSCVKRVRDKLGYPVGAGLIVQVLRGGKNQRVRELGLDALPTYGLMRETSQEQLRALLDCLSAKGYVFTEPVHSTLRLGASAAGVLFHGERVTMLSQLRPQEVPLPRQEDKASPPPADEGLLTALKAVRNRIAQRENVPGYIVFSNAALADMAARRPRTIDQFLEVSGVGQVKAARYGEAFLSAIAAYIEKH